MREIKFRAKELGTGKWVQGDLHILCTRPHIHHMLYIPDKSYIDLSTIGQFTGLRDKNGKEIYEGDIMGLPENDANGVKYKNRYTRVVEWINDGFFLLDYCTIGGEVRKYGDRLALEISLNSNYEGIARCFQKRGLDYTVIGNIHDNPELLKTKS